MPSFLAQYGYKVTAEQAPACGVAAQFPNIATGQWYCLSSNDKAIITSFLSIGTILGALSGAFVADRIGRRGGIIAAATVFMIGAIIQTAVHEVAGLTVGRVITGLGVGLISMMIPMMQAEISTAAIRGSMVSFYQLSITMGILVAQGADLGTQNFTSSASYRVPIGLQIGWALIVIFGALMVPESPRFLVIRGRIDDARASLARLRSASADSEEVNTELEEIQGNYEYELSLGDTSYVECFRGKMLPRTLVGILIQMFQQLTGVNFIFYYGTSFFIQAGIKQPYLITLATGLVNCGMTIPGIYLVEKIGRRKLLIGGAVWMSFCNLIIGAAAVGAPNSSSAQHVLVAFTLLFIGGFAASWGPGAWVVIAEIYPLKLRGKAMSLATASNWSWNWVIAFVVPYITDPSEGNLGSKIAFIWMATSGIAAAWTFFFVSETKGHTLEELDEMFETGLKPWQTNGWKPSGLSLHGNVHNRVDGAALDIKETEVEKVESV